MNNKTIAFYISSHGFGHLTRCLALIEYMLDTTDYSFYLCTAPRHIEFAQIYLDKYQGRVEYSEFFIEVGIINYHNSLQVDVEATNQAVYKLLETFEPRAEIEAKKLMEAGVKLILSDVTAFACLVAKKSGIKIVEMGNFTWVDQYKGLGVSQDIVDRFAEMYGYCDTYIAYPLGLSLQGAPEGSVYQSDYLTSRPIVQSRIDAIKKEYTEQYREKFGEDPESFLFLSLGRSAELPEVNITNFKGVVFYTRGVTFASAENDKILFALLPVEIRDTQSFIAASDLAVAKGGWTTASESVVAHTKILLIERPGVDDDTSTIETLRSMGIAASLTTDEVIHFDYKKMYERAVNEIDSDKLNAVRNSVAELSEKLLSYMDV